MSKQFAVVGSPIDHSRSPSIHASAYRVLGLDWSYSAVDVPEGRLRQFLETLDPSWQGLSVTMPLKLEATRLAKSLDSLAERTGVTNTLVREEHGWRGFNTDVFGIQKALHEPLLKNNVSVTIIGSGATATSAVFATYLSNPTARITLVVRNLQSGRELKHRAADSGFKIRIRTFRSFAFSVNRADVVISTLPSGVLDAYATKIVGRFTPKPRGVLLDVAYHPWPSKFASTWQSRSLQAVSGIEMLIFQAIAQVRVFTSGDMVDELPNERAVELAIRDSLGLI
jgi:shikimate dehydrogenase